MDPMKVENWAKESSGYLQWEKPFWDGVREFSKEGSKVFSGHKNVVMYDSHQEKAKLLILWAGNLWKVSASFSVQCQLIKGLVVSAFKMFEKPLLILIFFLNAPGKCIWRSVWKGQYEPNTTDSIWYAVSKLLFFIWWLRQAGNQRESMGNIFCILVVLFFFSLLNVLYQFAVSVVIQTDTSVTKCSTAIRMQGLHYGKSLYLRGHGCLRLGGPASAPLLC